MDAELQTGTVYQIWSPSNPKSVYVGATAQELSARKSGHCRQLKRWLADNTATYCTSYEVLQFADARIDWLETVRFSKKSELAAREGHWIRALDCVNKRLEGRTKAEYRADNHVGIAARKAVYHAANRVEIAARHAKNYVGNRVEIAAQRVEYRAAHRVEIAARKNVKYDCECGGKYTHGNTAVHKRSKMHIAYMAAQAT